MRKIGGNGFFIFGFGRIFLWASLVANCFAQTTYFGQPRDNYPRGLFSNYLVPGDVDGDGDLDILVLRGYLRFNQIKNDCLDWDILLLNDGSGRFRESPGAIPKGGVHDYYNGVAGDIDGDGDSDFVFSARFGGTGVYVNDSKGRFKFLSGDKVGLGGAYGPVYLSDFDGDGDLDLVVGRFFYLNDGTGKFSLAPTTRFPSIVGTVYGSCFGDFDGDGDTDVIYSGSFLQKTLLFFENKGKGFFQDQSQVRTPFAPFNDMRPLLEGVDVDCDGSLDLVIMPYAFLNDGKGRFSYSKKVALAKLGASARNEPSNCVFFDADGDGKKDFLGTAFSDFSFFCYPCSGFRGGRLRFYRNLGGGKFLDLSLFSFPRIRAWSIPFYDQVALGDFDGDGDQDVVLNNGVFLGFFNDGKGRFRLKTLRGIQLDGEEPLLELGRWGALGDLDGDGDVDWVMGVEYCCEPKRRALLVFMNDGEGNFKNETDQRVPSGIKMNNKGDRVDYLELHDVDQDGDQDILLYLSTSRQEILLVNDGKGRFSRKGVGGFFHPGYWMDVDGDGLEDSCYGVVWRKNFGNGAFKFKGRFVSSSLVQNPRLTLPGDFNLDGRKDLLCIDFQKTGTVLVEVFNLGKGRWKKGFSAKSGFQNHFYIVDIDHDGDFDIISDEGFFENDGVGGFKYRISPNKEVFGLLRPVQVNSFLEIMYPSVKDLDGDGFPEVIYNAKSPNDRWFPRRQPDPWWGSYVGVAKNLGDFRFRDATREYMGNFGTVGGTYGRIFLEDVDGDGDLDLLAQGLYQGYPQVWFNLHQQTAVSGTWGLGKKGHVEVYGHPGDQVLLLAGKPGKPVKVPGLGTWRLGGAVVPVLTATLAKAPHRVNALYDLEVFVPKTPALLGARIRFQSIIFRPGYGFKLTNSDTAVVSGL